MPETAPVGSRDRPSLLLQILLQEMKRGNLKRSFLRQLFFFSAGCCRGCWDRVLINSIPFSPPALPLFSLYCPEWGSCKKWRELRRHCCVSILILARGRPNQISYLHSMTHLSLLHVLHYSALRNRNTQASFSKCLLC